VVLSRDEVARLLNATTCLKHQAALPVAYGAGLRVAEVSMLKVADVDSERMLRGKGERYRNAMLSEDLLTLLRQWWKVAAAGRDAPRGWLFPGQHAMNPISKRQLYRIAVEAAQAADIAKRVGPHTLRHSFAPTSWGRHRHPDHPGVAMGLRSAYASRHSGANGPPRSGASQG
jgi:site-specific recombinase XerD